MNTYAKYAPNVFVAKTESTFEKGDIIEMTTKYGKTNECLIHNFLYNRGGFNYYSITRVDGFDSREWAKNKAEKFENAVNNSTKKADEAYKGSQEGSDFLALAEPIKIGHHSEKRHRALIERVNNRFGKYVEYSDKAEEQKARANYWHSKENDINLSMPESIEFYEFKLDEATKLHAEYKSGERKQEHAFSMTYAKKDVNKFKKLLEQAKTLWA